MDNLAREKMLLIAAKESLAEANFSFNNECYNLAIRRCQEAVELDASSLLAFLGIHFPKNHDLMPLIIKIMQELNYEKNQVFDKLEIISFDLSRKRGPALHQEEGYDKEVAIEAIENTKFFLTSINEIRQKLITHLKGLN